LAKRRGKRGEKKRAGGRDNDNKIGGPMKRGAKNQGKEKNIGHRIKNFSLDCDVDWGRKKGRPNHVKESWEREK